MADSKSSGKLPRGRLTVNLHEAKDLRKQALIGSIDPYVSLALGAESMKSRVVKKGGRTPKFNQSFLFNLEGKANEDKVHIKIFDKNIISDDTIGRLDVDVRRLIDLKAPFWFQMVSIDDFSLLCGDLLLSSSWQPEGAAGAAAAAAPPQVVWDIPPGPGGAVVKAVDQGWDPKAPMYKVQPPVPLTFRFAEFSCSGLKAADIGGSSDPFIVVSGGLLGNKPVKTDVRSSTLNPKWEHWHAKQWDVTCKTDIDLKDFIKFEVWDKDLIFNDFLGQALVPVLDLVEAFYTSGALTVNLTVRPNDPPSPVPLGSLTIRLQMCIDKLEEDNFFLHMLTSPLDAYVGAHSDRRIAYPALALERAKGGLEAALDKPDRFYDVPGGLSHWLYADHKSFDDEKALHLLFLVLRTKFEELNGANNAKGIATNLLSAMIPDAALRKYWPKYCAWFTDPSTYGEAVVLKLFRHVFSAEFNFPDAVKTALTADANAMKLLQNIMCLKWDDQPDLTATQKAERLACQAYVPVAISFTHPEYEHWEWFSPIVRKTKDADVWNRCLTPLVANPTLFAKYCATYGDGLAALIIRSFDTYNKETRALVAAIHTHAPATWLVLQGILCPIGQQPAIGFPGDIDHKGVCALGTKCMICSPPPIDRALVKSQTWPVAPKAAGLAAFDDLRGNFKDYVQRAGYRIETVEWWEDSQHHICQWKLGWNFAGKQVLEGAKHSSDGKEKAQWTAKSVRLGANERITHVEGCYNDVRILRLVLKSSSNRTYDIGQKHWSGTRFDWRAPDGHAVVGFHGAFSPVSPGALNCVGVTHMRTSAYVIPDNAQTKAAAAASQAAIDAKSQPAAAAGVAVPVVLVPVASLPAAGPVQVSPMMASGYAVAMPVGAAAAAGAGAEAKSKKH